MQDRRVPGTRVGDHRFTRKRSAGEKLKSSVEDATAVRKRNLAISRPAEHQTPTFAPLAHRTLQGTESTRNFTRHASARIVGRGFAVVCVRYDVATIAQDGIYYLGEYVRADEPPVLLRGADDRSGYCLRVRPAGAVAPADRFAQVEYRGRTYAVPISGARLGGEP